MAASYQQSTVVGMALDPIHVGTGGARLGRVDLSIVRDPVTRIPKIPGSSLAGVYRSYVAMALNKYPDCAGQGQPGPTGQGGHCGQHGCPICTVFGFARGAGGGFAGLAAFSDAHVLLFPVATREGPVWVTSPGALCVAGIDQSIADENKIYRKNGQGSSLNLGWLLLEGDNLQAGGPDAALKTLRIPDYIRDRIVLVSDKLFSHVVNSNLEVRTSVSINPETGAAEEGALFSYEALPRGTVLVWDVTCKNPKHFKVGGNAISAQVNSASAKIDEPGKVFEVVQMSHPYLEHLGIGGMGTRGMGRLRVVHPRRTDAAQPCVQQSDETEAHANAQGPAAPRAATQA